jgi:hypothetical protein
MEHSMDESERLAYQKLAWDLRTPAETLAILAGDEYVDYIRRAVAYNPNTPAEVLVRLARDVDFDIRMGVACNTNTPAEALTHLAGDKDGNIRWEVTWNPNTPELVKLYLKNPDFAELTLEEFLNLAK